jgi:opacity protein-like surface antigen
MKHIIYMALALVVFAAPSRAEIRFGGGVQGGMAISAFSSDFYGLGFGGGAHGDLRILDELTVRLSADYNMFPSNKDKVHDLFVVTDPNGNRIPFEVTGGNRTIVTIGVNAIGKIPTHSVVTPYGILGLGLNIGSMSDVKITASGETISTLPAPSADTRFGLNFGAGSEFSVSRSSRLFFEVKYVLIFTPDQSIAYVPFTLGWSF